MKAGIYMCRNLALNVEISDLKKRLDLTARQYKYNFNHPKVIALSQKLDALIITLMKKESKNPSI